MLFVFLGEEWWVGLETILPSAKKEVPRKVVGEGRSVHTIQETDNGRHTFVGVEHLRVDLEDVWPELGHVVPEDLCEGCKESLLDVGYLGCVVLHKG